MNQKSVFKNIFIVTAIVFSILPVIATFSSALTSLFEKLQWYVLLQEYVVPYESRLVAVIVKLVGINAQVPSQGDFSLALVKSPTEIIPIMLEWNCLGWQSMILLAITFITGLRGDYTAASKIETIITGILGTFISNLIRMAFIVSLAYYWSSFAAVIVHDYLASFIAIIWLIFFWWFSYRYILEPKQVEIRPFNDEEK